MSEGGNANVPTLSKRVLQARCDSVAKRAFCVASVNDVLPTDKRARRTGVIIHVRKAVSMDPK